MWLPFGNSDSDSTATDSKLLYGNCEHGFDTTWRWIKLSTECPRHYNTNLFGFTEHQKNKAF